MRHNPIFLGATLAAGLLLPQCANKATTTRVAVKNTNGFTVNTVTVKSSDNSKTATFTGISAGATSPFQEISFPSLTGVAVSCDTNGCDAGSISLTDGSDNTITVTSGVTVGAPTVTPGTGGGW